MTVPSPEDVFAAVASRPGVAWLDSSDGQGWSVLTWDPSDVVRSREWTEAARRLLRPSPVDPSVPFSGGLLGYLAYEAGDTVAPVPAGRPTPEPHVHLARYDGALCHEHATGRWVAAGTPAFRRDAERVLAAARPAPPPPPPPAEARASTVERVAFEAAVRRVLELVHAGDCYQVNLTRPVHVRAAGDPVAAFRRLRRAPAAYGAFLRVDERVVLLSNSPELFLEVRGRSVRSDPIKGTRPRGPGDEDRRLRDELWSSAKDAAELTMIVDLVRNDLARVAVPGSVRAGARELRSHATVHHTHWPVHATLGPGADAIDAVAAAFPPGSVTGAPKRRACERIAELEPEARGLYTGALGYLADGGDAALSVAIRVAVFDGSDARYHVGGGVVAASDPAAEWEETVVKGVALGRALLP